MSWVSLLIGVIKLSSSLLSFLHARKLISLAETKAAANLLKEQSDALRLAIEVRERVERDLAANPGRVHDDDGFRRD